MGLHDAERAADSQTAVRLNDINIPDGQTNNMSRPNCKNFCYSCCHVEQEFFLVNDMQTPSPQKESIFFGLKCYAMF